MVEKIKQKRNIGIDIARLFFSFVIVCYHSGAYREGIPYTLIKPFLAISAVFFITVSGYFHHYVEEKGLEKKEIINFLKYTVFVNFVYYIWTWIESIINGEGLFEYVLSPINRYDIFNFLVFNESPFRYHLWYLGSVLYVLIIYRICNKYNKKKILFSISPFLYIAGVLLDKYSILILGQNFPIYFTRNFLFYALPFFCLGDLMWIFKDKLASIETKKYLYLFIVSYITGILESVFVMKYLKIDRGHLFLSSALLLFSIFMLLTKIYDYRKGIGIERFLAKLGRNDSSFIYFWQYIVMYIIRKLLKLLNVNYTGLLIAILTFITCIILSELIIYIKKKYFWKKRADVIS